MKKIFPILIALFCISSVSFAQTQESDINQSVKEALEEVNKAIEKIEIPEIDVEKIIEEVEAALPTKEQMEDIKEGVQSAIKEIEKIDLSGIEAVLRDLEDIFSDFEIDIRKDKDSKKDDSKREKKDF